MARSHASAGFTALELAIVVALVMTVLMMGLPRTVRAYETGRVQYAEAALDTLWTAQRLHRVHAGRFSADLQALADARLVPAGMAGGGPIWDFDLPFATRDTFTARAVRQPSGGWSGALLLDENGGLTGGSSHALGGSVQP